MSDKSSYAQQANLERNLGISPSAIRYIALNTTTGSNTTPGTECADASYARQVIGWGPLLTTVDSQLVTGSVGTGITASITFPAFSTSQTIAEWSIHDALSGGNRYYHKAIASATWPAGYAISFASGSITVQEQ